MMLTEREHEFGELETRAADARAGRGGAMLVCGESGGGKTSFVESFIRELDAEVRVLWGACDPLSTPRPLGPLHDLADQFDPTTQLLLRNSDQPFDIFAAVFDDLRAEPTIVVLDDLHWADQATIDLFRFLLRRAPQTNLFLIGIARDDEVGVTHPLRGLLGDVARSPHARSLTLPPLSLHAVTRLVGDRSVDPAWLHRVTGGNAFFVCEMLDHRTGELPTTVRDAILARTAGLDSASWDLLNLLTCAPGAIADHLLADLGVTMSALRALDDAKLIRRNDRGVAFRHDLCRLAITSVIPPGAEPELHRRFINAHHASSNPDPAVITHHALGAGNRSLITQAATDAGRAAARTGAHTQATEFFRIALDQGGIQHHIEAEVLELLAAEYYLTDRLDDAIDACRRAMVLREAMRADTAVSANHHALAVYEWYNANRAVAEEHVAAAIAGLDGNSGPDEPTKLAQLGHAFALQAFLAVQSSRLDTAAQLLERAGEIAAKAGDPTLVVRVELILGFCAILSGRQVARNGLLEILTGGPRHIDEIYSSGYTNLTYFDVEQRRLDAATDLLDVSIPLMVEHDLPVCHVVQLGSRSRLKLLVGDWSGALADSDLVLGKRSAPLARTWPLLIRALVSLRRIGDDLGGLDEAWHLAWRFGEPVRLIPVASAIVEKTWLTGMADDRLDQCRSLLDSSPAVGLEWTRGDLAMWLYRIGDCVEPGSVAPPYRLLLDGQHQAAGESFEKLSTPYDAAHAFVDSGDAALARRALDILDRLGADAVAAKVRYDLRARGATAVPAPRRATTLANPAGLTTRQIEVLRLLESGLTNAELAEQLYLSVKTVDHHVSAILNKLQVTGRREAVRRARETGILQ
ncbi:LuxR family transcriptional regulator [Nocardiaceae bacterium YC2-7]|uniref:LuxR family transcriptional regulator n=2 Tax=Antrihabitans stalactiti TaxID=2584121 RepID=A0A848KEJ9_9NOCA|nr:LuxR family transcriptional regulator [Antrihabitans stalactiti]